MYILSEIFTIILNIIFMCETVVEPQSLSSSRREVTPRTGMSVVQMSFQVSHQMTFLSFGQRTFGTSPLIVTLLLYKVLDLLSDFSVFV